MNIVLIGYRGCGKTTAGKKLSNALWKTFVDTDDEVCKRFGGLTIKEIWEQHGEPAYREMECEVVANVLGGSDQVIGLGGGTLMQEKARAAVASADDAKRVYLKCDAATLFERIEGDDRTNATRPNLTALGGGLDEVEKVLAEREPVYAEIADHTLDVTRMAPEDVVKYLIQLFL